MHGEDNEKWEFMNHLVSSSVLLAFSFCSSPMRKRIESLLSYSAMLSSQTVMD